MLKYSHLTHRLTYFAARIEMVVIMNTEQSISKEYLSTFNRKIQTQIYTELHNDYARAPEMWIKKSALYEGENYFLC
jgi:hypothetical protein